MLTERLGRRGRVVALTAALLLSLTLPTAAQAALVQGAPAGVQAGFFDDHSIGTDNHTGWSMGGSEPEPLAIVFGTTLTSTGSDFRVCGYSSGTPGWLRSHLVSAATCPGTAPAGQTGWMRYITANHDQTATRLFNRWHVMDLQRFALVPLPAAAGGPAAGTPTAWDNFWGTCLSNGSLSMECAQSPAATNVPTAIPANTPKTTQEENPAPDAQRIAIPAEARFQFPDGRYQVVAMANPYGNYGASRSVACTTIQLSGMGAYAPVATVVDQNAATCYVPANPPAPLTGPGGRDPMANAAVGTACVLQTTGHCWATPPATPAEEPFAPHPLARSNVTVANAITPTSIVGVAQTPSTAAAATPSSGANNPPAAASGRVTSRRITARVSRSYSRKALRKQFGRRLSRVRVTCRVRTSSASTCRVSFRKSGARYSGNVWLRYRTVNSRLRWQYRVEVKKRKSGERTRTIKRSYRTGGTF